MFQIKIKNQLQMTINLKTIAIVILFLLSAPIVRAELKDEILEKKTKQLEQAAFESEAIEQKEEQKKKNYKLSSTIGLEASYETNPRLATSGKGDKSGRSKFSTHYKRTLAKGLMLNFNYNFDGTLYTEFTDLINILNHGRLSLDKSFNKYLTAGMGYDVSTFYYPNEEDSDYNLHKGFIYLKHNINKNIYHQIMWEEGVKNYVHAKAYSTSTTDYLDAERQDFRHAAEYSIAMTINAKSSFRIRTKYTINDSNALFQDYHNYKSWDLTPSFSYKLTNKLGSSVSMGYSDKYYTERLVTNNTNARHDLTYSPNISLRYDLTKSQTITLGYGFTQNISNEITGEYKSSTVSCGWQYGF